MTVHYYWQNERDLNKAISICNQILDNDIWIGNNWFLTQIMILATKFGQIDILTKSQNLLLDQIAKSKPNEIAVLLHQVISTTGNPNTYTINDRRF